MCWTKRSLGAAFAQQRRLMLRIMIIQLLAVSLSFVHIIPVSFLWSAVLRVVIFDNLSLWNWSVIISYLRRYMCVCVCISITMSFPNVTALERLWFWFYLSERILCEQYKWCVFIQSLIHQIFLIEEKLKTWKSWLTSSWVFSLN